MKKIVLLLCLLCAVGCAKKGDKGDAGPIGPGANITTYTGTIPTDPNDGVNVTFDISAPVLTENSLPNVLISADMITWISWGYSSINLNTKKISMLIPITYSGQTYKAIIQNPS
jgi:hypothetical protein